MEKSRTARLRRKNVFLAILGTLFISLGTSFFVLPYGLITGGISGISILLASILPAVSMEWWIAMLTWGLFLLGAFTLGRDFALKTLVSTLIYPVGIALFSLLFDTLSSTALFDLNSG